MKKLSLILILKVTTVLGSCDGNNSRDDNKQTDARSIRESLMGANAILIDTEDQEIRDFIERHGWEMNETGSGLRYIIYDRGTGEKVVKDRIAVFHYSLHLITGDLVYSSRDQSPGQFQVGRGGVESGLEEGILLLRAGDKARFIMPSHLAHGVPGDGVKIPRRATLIYDVELIDVY